MSSAGSCRAAMSDSTAATTASWSRGTRRHARGALCRERRPPAVTPGRRSHGTGDDDCDFRRGRHGYGEGFPTRTASICLIVESQLPHEQVAELGGRGAAPAGGSQERRRTDGHGGHDARSLHVRTRVRRATARGHPAAPQAGLLRHPAGLQSETRDGLGEDGRDQRARDPLVVGRDDVPRRPLGARGGQRVLVGVPGSRPSRRARARSAVENFQCFSGSSSRSRKRFFCSSFETFRKNLRITRAVADEVPLEGVDVLVAVLPERLAALPRPAAAGARAPRGGPSRPARPRSTSG